mgnify:CR=1 FL=1
MLEAILLQAEVLELKANPNRNAEGTVIESKIEKGKGTVASILVQNGSLKVGDIIVVGKEWGKARAIYSDQGIKLSKATPSPASPPLVPFNIMAASKQHTGENLSLLHAGLSPANILSNQNSGFPGTSSGVIDILDATSICAVIAAACPESIVDMKVLNPADNAGTADDDANDTNQTSMQLEIAKQVLKAKRQASTSADVWEKMGSAVTNMTLDEILHRLRGEIGSPVKLSVLRKLCFFSKFKISFFKLSYSASVIFGLSLSK